mmetsp:Transcript_25304/g.74428  ORF Transcript_25304/g.74428 Transcript_25304/m.74428 type:complete len:171 (+) Transcript_25304:134-646(+)
MRHRDGRESRRTEPSKRLTYVLVPGRNFARRIIITSSFIIAPALFTHWQTFMHADADAGRTSFLFLCSSPLHILVHKLLPSSRRGSSFTFHHRRDSDNQLRGAELSRVDSQSCRGSARRREDARSAQEDPKIIAVELFIVDVDFHNSSRHHRERISDWATKFPQDKEREK